MQNSPQVSADSVFVFGLDLDRQATREFAINLITWSKNNGNKPLRININSGGGNFQDCLALKAELNRLRHAGHHLTIAVYGRAASCCAWLLQVADRRIIDADSWLLIHEVSSSVSGGLSAMKREVARVEQLQNQSIELLTRRSKLTAEVINRNIADGHDWWLTAKEALELGLVDEIEEIKPFAN